MLIDICVKSVHNLDHFKSRQYISM